MSRRKCSSSRCVFFPEPHKKRLRSADVAAADVAGSIGMEAWDHFNAWGSMEGRIWHSELCGEECTYVTASFDWVDATRGSPIPMGDDDQKRVELPVK